MLGKFTREDESDTGNQVRVGGCEKTEANSRGLDLSGRDGGLLVVCGELGGLGGDTLEDVVDERVQDRHGTVGDTSVGVDLLEN